jgi:hypothetical protein
MQRVRLPECLSTSGLKRSSAQQLGTSMIRRSRTQAPAIPACAGP